MSEQRHFIKRQVLELKVRGSEDARQLQAEMSHIYRRRIVPLIDRYCTEFSDPETIHRIETLDVDIGVVDPAHLERDMVARVDQRLRQLLAEQIRGLESETPEPEKRPKTRSQLELFVLFVRTGSLPWWADASQPRLIEDSLDTLLRDAPRRLRKLFRDFAQTTGYLARIAQHVSDQQLAALIQTLTPAVEAAFIEDIQHLTGLLRRTKTGTSRPAAKIRRHFWVHGLTVAGYEGEGLKTETAFFRAVFRRLAPDLGVSYPRLLAELQELLPTGRGELDESLLQILGRLIRDDGEVVETPKAKRMDGKMDVREGAAETLAEAADMPAETKGRAVSSGPGGSKRDAARETEKAAEGKSAGGTSVLDERSKKARADLWGAIRTVVPYFPAVAQRELMAGLQAIEQAEAEKGALPRDLVRRVIRLLKGWIRLANIPLKFAGEWQALGEKLAAKAGLHPEDAQSLAALLESGTAASSPIAQVEQESAPVDLSFSAGDELYIGNAGLVILWPFLANFFDRLKLIEEKMFVDEAARMRAVALLQYLAAGELEFPEYLLPLNKALCGMELSAVFEPEMLLTEAETEECENFLTAVIANAPILRNMSPDGFRGTFLRREGVMRTRDGAWLLQVERETFDVVLDRIPWGWEWVKLPWMEAPLRVEW